METSVSNRKSSREAGFTLLETMVSIVILTVGLLGLAALMSKTTMSTDQSKYVSMAAFLASEKLEDLNRFPPSDRAILVTSGTTAGDLSQDSTSTVTSGGVSENIDYFDKVTISAGNGSISETITARDVNGNVVYKTVTHSPDGTVTPSDSSTQPSTNGSMVFNRRWVIEKDPVVGASSVIGVRRITVRVTLAGAVGGNVTFQSSMVRQ
jgi:type IV pilus modification protein PilV